MQTLAVVLAAEAEEGGSGLDLLLPPIPELIGGIIAFGIVFLTVWRFAAPAFNKMLEDRQGAIGGKLEEAETIKAEAEQLRADYHADLKESRTRATEIVEQARSDAETLRADIVAKAETEAEEIRTRAREEAEAEKGRALADARREVANLSIDLAEKVVGESLDHETQMGLVNRYLSDLESM
ncbi:MAG: F0F1 ATP synthase subunit B [Acidimicrobiia bacterium]|nr:F0F1 ATP synthase subunit B [Acidimicrobiia bacterium]